MHSATLNAAQATSKTTQRNQLKQEIVKSLKGWWQSSQAEVNPTESGHLVYGTGYNTWGVQTQQKALSVAAFLALHGDAVAREQFLGLLRFNLHSHVSTNGHCMDGEQWGHTWISVLGIERMMFAIEDVIEAGLIPQSDLDALRRVLISEADWILNDYEIVAGLVDNNKPESNIWNGSILHRVALMYPDTSNAAAYREKGDVFLLNGISIESDLLDTRSVAGKVLKDHVRGANFFDSMALNHHHYLNVGYMVICLSNIAMLHFTFKRNGQAAPAALYHNVEKLWALIKMMSFEDGRLWRIGGDTRARYCYCQDYALPMWMLIEDYLQEDCSAFINGWCQQVFTEQEHNTDDLYLSERLSQMQEYSPLYFTRLESDRACTLAMTAAWSSSLKTEQNNKNTALLSEWHDAYHAAYAVRGDFRCASWVWAAGEGPTGTCVPPQSSALAEWGVNLFPVIRGSGDRSAYRLLEQHGNNFEHGFATIGKVAIMDHGVVTEGGVQGYKLAEAQVLAIALPDQKSCVYLQYAKTSGAHYFREVSGLHLKVPNDIWNGFERLLSGDNFSRRCVGNDGQGALIATGSKSLNIDQQLRVQSFYQNSEIDQAQELQIRHQAQRGTGLRHLGMAQVQRVGGCLFTEDIFNSHFAPASRQHIAANTCVLDTAFSVSCDASIEFKIQDLGSAVAGVKSFMLSHGTERYYIAVNFSEKAAQIEIPVSVSILASNLNEQKPGHLAPLAYIFGTCA